MKRRNKVNRKKGLSMISLTVIVVLIVVLAVCIISLLREALNNHVNNFEKIPNFVDNVLGD